MIYFLKPKNWEKVVKIKENHFQWGKQCNFGEAGPCWGLIFLMQVIKCTISFPKFYKDRWLAVNFLFLMIYFLKPKNWEKVVKIKENHFQWGKQCKFWRGRVMLGNNRIADH